MTSDRIARDYLRRCRVRRRALDTLMEGGVFADVVRESQELVELLMKGLVRYAGVDPPRKHDVRGALLRVVERFEPHLREGLQLLAADSSGLARDRSSAFYGDDEAMVAASDLFDRGDAERALAIADRALALSAAALKEP